MSEHNFERHISYSQKDYGGPWIGRTTLCIACKSCGVRHAVVEYDRILKEEHLQKAWDVVTKRSKEPFPFPIDCDECLIKVVLDE